RGCPPLGVSSSNWLEHRTPNPGVAGSSPAWPVTLWERRDASNHHVRRTNGRRGEAARREHAMEQQTGGRQPQGGLGQVVEFVPRSAEFIKESWQELKKVHWPTRKETYSATVIVIVAVVVVAGFLGLVDFALSYAMRYIMGNA